jgi:transposase
MRSPQCLTLSDEDRSQLDQVLHRGKANARTLARVRILLKSAEGWSATAITDALDVSAATVWNVRKRYREGGIERVLHDRVQAHRRSALSGLQTAHLIAIACTPAPDGHDHWTVRLLADKAVELGYVEQISLDTIHRLLKKTTPNPGGTNTGVYQKRVANL